MIAASRRSVEAIKRSAAGSRAQLTRKGRGNRDGRRVAEAMAFCQSKAVENRPAAVSLLHAAARDSRLSPNGDVFACLRGPSQLSRRSRVSLRRGALEQHGIAIAHEAIPAFHRMCVRVPDGFEAPERA